MQNFQRDKLSKLKQKDLIFFKNSILVFLLCTILAFVVELIPTIRIFAQIISIISFIALTIVYYNNQDKYSELSKTDKRVGLLLILVIIVGLVNVFVSFLIPIPSNISNISETITAIAKLKNSINVLVLESVASAIIILIETYYFTNWFNQIYGLYNPTKVYFYFGISSCIAEIISSFG